MLRVKYTESDFYDLHLLKCGDSLVSDYLRVINNETLGRKVAIALSQKKQGHFDKAMLSISEVNRDQVLAIREAQEVLDKLENRKETAVIFEKYRQTFPFQIGLTNGEEVLNLLTQIKSIFTDGYHKITNELYKNEKEVGALIEELMFFEKRGNGKVTEEELDSMRENIAKLSDKILFSKKKIIDHIFDYLSKNINVANNDDTLKLIKNIYLIITSSVETLNARLVEV